MYDFKNLKLINPSIITLYIVGAINWLFFFNYGEPSFFYEDWSFYFQFYSTWKEAITSYQIPFFVTIFSNENFGEHTGYGSTLFFAKPWSIFQPQVLLMYFIEVKTFIIFNYLLFYSILFYSLLVWSDYLKLSLIPAVFLIIIITFNGKLFAQSGLGGPQMTFGYMLAPSLFWFFKKAFFDYSNKFILKRILFFSLFLAFVLAQCDIHILYQMTLICGLIIIFYPKKYINFCISILILLTISIWFWLPVLFYGLEDIYPNISEEHWRYYGTFGYGFQNGFAGRSLILYDRLDHNLITLVKLLTNIILHYYESFTAHHNAAMPNTHEYNLYVSLLGLIMIVIFISSYFYKLITNRGYYKNLYKFSLSFMLILILSSGPFHYFLIKFIKIFFSFKLIDAVPSRYLFYCFVILAFISALGFERLLKLYNFKFTKLFFSLLNLILLIILIRHSYTWWLSNSYSVSSTLLYRDLLDITFYNPSGYKNYKIMVILTYSFSFISFCGLLAYGSYLKIKDGNK